MSTSPTHPRHGRAAASDKVAAERSAGAARLVLLYNGHGHDTGARHGRGVRGAVPVTRKKRCRTRRATSVPVSRIAGPRRHSLVGNVGAPPTRGTSRGCPGCMTGMRHYPSPIPARRRRNSPVEGLGVGRPPRRTRARRVAAPADRREPADTPSHPATNPARTRADPDAGCPPTPTAHTAGSAGTRPTPPPTTRLRPRAHREKRRKARTAEASRRSAGRIHWCCSHRK